MTHNSPLEVSGGDTLGRVYEFKLRLGHKIDLTSRDGYLSGRWVTIMPANGLAVPMNLAEIRVYGSKCSILFASKHLKFAYMGFLLLSCCSSGGCVGGREGHSLGPSLTNIVGITRCSRSNASN